MSLQRRTFIGMAAGAAFGPALAADFPEPGRPIRFIIPAPPGGPADLMARALQPSLTAQLNGASIVIESKPGGATVIGANIVAKSPPDGYTLLLTISSTHTQGPHLLNKIPYDPLKDFTPITQLFKSPSIVCANNNFKAQNLKELVEMSRTAGPIAAASAGIGTNGHLYIEMLNRLYGANLTHIPYKGASEGQRDLQSGIVPIYFDSAASAIPIVRGNRVKALGLSGTHRLEALPDVPTATEQGFPALSVEGWFGVFGPANMPPAVVERLNKAIVTALKGPEIQRQFGSIGMQPTGNSAQEFADIVRNDHQVWGKLIRDAGIKIEQ